MGPQKGPGNVPAGALRGAPQGTNVTAGALHGAPQSTTAEALQGAPQSEVLGSRCTSRCPTASNRRTGIPCKSL